MHGFRDYSLAPIFYSIELERGTGIDILSSSLRHSYTVDDDFWQTHASWINNGLNYQEDQMWGGWENLTLTFHILPNTYIDSVYTFTMYYELYPVTAAGS